MQTIGLIGGMSWESTASYYQLLNQGIKYQLGGFHSAKIVLVSVDFAQIEQLQRQGDWSKTAEILGQAAQSLQAAGADFFLICTNTMHLVAQQIEEMVTIPLLHIADATAQQLQKDNIETVGLLGTVFTMQRAFYKGRIMDKFGIKVIVPDQEEQTMVHQTIYQELCLGKITEESKIQFLNVIQNLVKKGAQGVILGCTEIGLLIDQADTETKLYDTTTIHARSAVEQSINNN